MNWKELRRDHQRKVAKDERNSQSEPAKYIQLSLLPLFDELEINARQKKETPLSAAVKAKPK
jgi:hypothetical protein